ncbi:alr0857 family protein [Nostoc sp. T09]|uniref:alr0857 family protein n=1 Tax=Nostoc sp. T09 TaxID=1932621 RepID=UPI0026969F42|nr:alr0857 family protein [Nostoc sp. T09]
MKQLKIKYRSANMLKLTYTENSFSLEYLEESLVDWVNQRVVLALHSATNIYIESSNAAFVLPTELSRLANLEKLKQENILEIYPCDASNTEVILKGTWITSHQDSETGIFVTSLSKSAELLLQQLSQTEQLCYV